MSVAVISDIQGNLEALEAVLTGCDEAGVDEFYCLGDVVGYWADSVVCLVLVRERAAFVRGQPRLGSGRKDRYRRAQCDSCPGS